MRESPFDDYMILPETIEYTYSSNNEWWTEMIAYGWESQIKSVASSMDVTRKEIQKSAFEKVKEFRCKEGLVFSRKVLFILADKH
jgi:hypothetical protein